MPSKDLEQNPKHHDDLLSPPSCVLLLNGFPGVGKFTIAKALEARLKLSDIPHRLIDNHLLIDPAVAIEPVRNTAHYRLRKLFRKTALEGLKTLKEEGLVIILTAALSTSSFPVPYDDIDQSGEYVNIAESRGVPLVVVNIVCDLSANSERLCNAERRQVNGKAKLVDVDVLERLRRETSLLDWEDVMTYWKRGNIFHFELDTSELDVDQTTQMVWKLLCEEVGEK